MVAWRRGWLCKLAPMQKKTSFFQELKRGQKATAALRVEAGKCERHERNPSSVEDLTQPERGVEHRTSGSLGFRPGPRCLRCTTWCVCWAGLSELQS